MRAVITHTRSPFPAMLVLFVCGLVFWAVIVLAASWLWSYAGWLGLAAGVCAVLGIVACVLRFVADSQMLPDDHVCHREKGY